MIKSIAITSIIASWGVAATLFFWLGFGAGFSVAATTALLTLNLLGLFIFWRVVFLKKSIALGLLIIILKYPLLGYLIWLMSKQSWVHPIGVLLGILAFLLSLVGVALYYQRKIPVQNN